MWRCSLRCSRTIDAERGWSVAQAAVALGASVREYRELAAGARWPNRETFDRNCELFGWPQTFVTVL